MAFLCFIHQSWTRVPYMEVLPEHAIEDAMAHARRLLLDRPNCSRAEIFEDDRPVAILEP
jgi:hypothetical protein